MANFSKAIVKTLAKEGGAIFTDDPNDAGGATKYGISQRAYPNVDIRNLTEQQAREIYGILREKWNKGMMERNRAECWKYGREE